MKRALFGWRSRALVCALSVLAFTGLTGCKKPPPDKKGSQAAADTADDAQRPLERPPIVREDDDDASEESKLVYLVASSRQLYSFNPRVPGIAAYKLVGKLGCKTWGTPQSMAVDRKHTAWVFYETGELFKVNISDASCSPTDYRHPSPNHVLGMGFTAAGPGSREEKLFIVGPSIGLSTISMPDLGVTVSEKLRGMNELTGGGDGKLFRFDAMRGELSEVDPRTFAVTPIYTFKHLGQPVNAYAFARYAGRFYVFTSTMFAPSTVHVYDPATHEESIRDPAIGFVVVGAGQSTLVPMSDTGGGSGDKIRGEFPEDMR